MIEWNDGLNLGVEDLDNDHKNLLRIINSLSDVTGSDNAQNLLEDIFKELEKYIDIHFTREEDYLEKCNCRKLDEHVGQHRAFAAKIPKLKAKVLSSQSSTTVQEVCVYLTDWLLNHIMEEDIPAITLFKECGITKKEEEDYSFLARLIKRTTDKFSFTKRIFLSAMIPLIGMMLFGSIIIFANFNKYMDMKTTSTITHITYNVNELVHNLQIERGLSSGYLTSTKNKFKNRLQKQRELADYATKKFTDKIKTIHTKNITTIEENIKTFKTDILSLDNLRKQIDDKKISQVQTIDFYTKIIENILNITPKIASINLDIELSSSIATLSSLQHLKESLGLERAYGTIIIEKKYATVKEFIAFTQLLGTQIAFLNTFEHTASEKQKRITDFLKNSAILKQINAYEEKLINRNFNNLDSEIWFKYTTEYINKIKLFENELLSEINTLIDSQIDETIVNFLLWIAFNLIILAITLFILYTFKKSTIMQIHQLTNAMKDLATGGRALRLSPISINRDELAYMYDAYETTRQKLLRGDIYTQLYLSQKEMELKNKQIENTKLEEIAYVDSLTGTINRRKFEELSSIELERATRYKHNLSFLMLDIDYFKNINDTYGHAVGDIVLKEFSSICKNMARGLDIVARIGGEEFVVMLPETDQEGAYIFAERFRKKVSSSKITIQEHEIRYTVSIGISILDVESDTDIETILKRADKALYIAKNSGRNTTVYL